MLQPSLFSIIGQELSVVGGLETNVLIVLCKGVHQNQLDKSSNVTAVSPRCGLLVVPPSVYRSFFGGERNTMTIVYALQALSEISV